MSAAWPTTLEAWLRRCEGAHPVAIDLSLERVQAVGHRLGLRFAVPVIVVAGTNGKGSTCALIDSLARAAGRRVGLYSKPHLVDFEERCRIDGQVVAAQALLPHFEAVERARDTTSLTLFEHSTLAILRLLSQAALDLVVLEVGLGGRFDAVNVVDADCAVITGVDIDHAEFLGLTREDIGIEKAGVMRPGRPVVLCEPAPPRSVLCCAQAVGARVLRAGHDFEALDSGEGPGGTWAWRSRERWFDTLPAPALRGAEQRQNAAGALAALQAAMPGLPLDRGIVVRGLQQVRLPGRFQVCAGDPVWVLDVAHNPQAARALAHNLATARAHAVGGRLHAVFGCMRDKDIVGVLAALAPAVAAWYFTDLPMARAAAATALPALLPVEPHGPWRTSCWADPASALHAAERAAMPGDWIVVFGSFLTVAGVLHIVDADNAHRGGRVSLDRSLA